jgi:hypothetical protein
MADEPVADAPPADAPPAEEAPAPEVEAAPAGPVKTWKAADKPVELSLS